MQRHIFRKLPFILMVALSVVSSAAQEQCATLLERTLQAVGENCEAADRNEACYGFNEVSASFVQDVPEDFFTQPSDISNILDIETIRTAPLQLDEEIWGIAVMNLQADVPDTIPGQNVTFILIGDVEVENSVDPDQARQPIDPVPATVTARAGANIRSGPGTNFNVLGGARPETVLEADGLSDDGQWLRVALNERPAWVSLTTVSVDDEAFNTLPTISALPPAPMQAFYLRSGIGRTTCADVVTDSLLVQGPQNLEVTLNVNGANVEIGSSGILRIVEIDGELFLENIVFDGEWNWDGVIVRRGQSTTLCLGDEEDSGLDGEDNDRRVTCGASEPRFIPASEFADLFCAYESVLPALLNYQLDVPCPDDVVAGSSSSSSGGGSISQIDEVDCSGFAIPSQTIIANNFTFNWPDVPGADSYVVALFDENANELLFFTTTQSSLPTNGGNWPPAGFVDVRAYRNGEYACFARLNFTRRADPGGGGPSSSAPTGDFTAVLISCVPSGLDYVATVQWRNAPGGSVDFSWVDFNGSPTKFGGGVNGSIQLIGQYYVNNISATSGGRSLLVGNCS